MCRAIVLRLLIMVEIKIIHYVNFLCFIPFRCLCISQCVAVLYVLLSPISVYMVTSPLSEIAVCITILSHVALLSGTFYSLPRMYPLHLTNARVYQYFHFGTYTGNIWNTTLFGFLNVSTT